MLVVFNSKTLNFFALNISEMSMREYNPTICN
jgi:hypothetical protein